MPPKRAQKEQLQECKREFKDLPPRGDVGQQKLLKLTPSRYVEGTSLFPSQLYDPADPAIQAPVAGYILEGDNILGYTNSFNF